MSASPAGAALLPAAPLGHSSVRRAGRVPGGLGRQCCHWMWQHFQDTEDTASLLYPPEFLSHEKDCSLSEKEFT